MYRTGDLFAALVALHIQLSRKLLATRSDNKLLHSLWLVFGTDLVRSVQLQKIHETEQRRRRTRPDRD